MTTKTQQKFRQTHKTWVAIYPSITLITLVFGAQLSALPLYLRTFVLTVVLVPWLVFVVLPVIDLCLSKLEAKTQT